MEWLINWLKRLQYRGVLREIPSPKARTKREDIEQLPDGTLIIRGLPPGCWITTVANTGSMEPLIDEGSWLIMALVSGDGYLDLKVGDVIYFEHPDLKALHWIDMVSKDNTGWFCMTRGLHPDIPFGDLPKIRPEHVKSVLRVLIPGGD